MWRPSMSLINKKSKLSAVKTPASSKRRRKASVSDDEDSKPCKIKREAPPMSKIYNSSFRNNKPAELFRKDLISAMKMADSDHLAPEDYWLMTDAWKEEWERGVQVPVNPEILPDADIRISRPEINEDFKLPKKFLHNAQDENFNAELHIISAASTVADKACRYDLDDMDTQWLQLLNEERDDLGLPTVEEVAMEVVMEELETQCFDNLQAAIKSQEGLGIEYDEDVICDVCRSPDSEDGNEMVFCDACNICVHQACYGITAIPEGSWVCRTCALGIRPSCDLCPNKGGAMKSTKGGSKWAHVSCALWVPEVSIGCVDKMEPITKISQIPPSRWSLLCTICKDRTGACIQCSVKTCKTAYHVTCAFTHGLEMKAIIDEDNEDDGVKLRSYCEKHNNRDANYSSDSDPPPITKKRDLSKKKDLNSKKPDLSKKNDRTWKELEMCTDDKAGAREKRIVQVRSEFYKHVSPKRVAEGVGVDSLVVDFIYHYWKLKRKANFDKPLLTPKAEESDALSRQQEDSLYARMKMFVHLRQDLERVRNLCYMVIRREKISRSLFKVREEVFKKQVALLTRKGSKLTEKERQAIIQANHGDNIYDRLYARDSERFPVPNAVVSVLEGKESVLQDLMSMKRFVKKPEKVVLPSSAEKQQESHRDRAPNPYAKQYFNGIRRSNRRFSSLFELDGKGGPDMDDSCAAGPSTGIHKERKDSEKTEENFDGVSLKSELKDDFSLCGDSSESFMTVIEKGSKIKLNESNQQTEVAEKRHFDMQKLENLEATFKQSKTLRPDTPESVTSLPESCSGTRKVLQTKKPNNASSQIQDVNDLPEEVKLLNEIKATIAMNETLTNLDGKENGEKVVAVPVSDECEAKLNPQVSATTACTVSTSKESVTITSLNSDDKSKIESLDTSLDANKVKDLAEKVFLENINTDSDTSVASSRLLRSGRDSATRNNSSSDEIRSEQSSAKSGCNNATNNKSRLSKDKLKSKPVHEKDKLLALTSPKKEDALSPSKAPKLFPRTCLLGYRIPKKKNESSDSENTKDTRSNNSPLSPLSDMASKKPDSVPLYNQKPVRHSSPAQPLLSQQQVPPQQNSWGQTNNGENLNQSPRLVIKLRKDPDSPRWRSDAFNAMETSPEMSFHVIQNDWGVRNNNNRRSDRQRNSNSVTPDVAYKPEVAYSSDNGSRYPIRFRNNTVAQKPPPKHELAS